MKLAKSSLIAEIDNFAQSELGIDITDLIERSGLAVSRVVREYTPRGERVILLCGKGYNGADGYAAAINLLGDYDITVYDVFGEGQREEGGRHFLEKFVSLGGDLRTLDSPEDLRADLAVSKTVVDAIFGTGFRGDIPKKIRDIAIVLSETVGVNKIAVDVPIGVNADDGSVDICAAAVSATVELCFIKPGIVSYPARAFVGRIILDDLALPQDKLLSVFNFRYNYVDEALATSLLPKRESNSSKGSFGKLLLITGSERYRGAAHLSLEAALRGGAGYVTYFGVESLVNSLSAKFPEALYRVKKPDSELTREDISAIVKESEASDVTLIGSGSESTPALIELTRALITSGGGTLILDADAINCLCKDREENVTLIRESKRNIILTPHPLEFARISGTDVASVQRNRISASVKFAKENRCTVVLKGAGTIITDGDTVYINSSGSSALAKAGSGDVLAGFIASLSSGIKDPITAAVLAVFFHGMAADRASDRLSSYGVTPSDLPLRIAEVVGEIEKKRDN